MIPFLCLEKKRSNHVTPLLKNPFMIPHCQPSEIQAPYLAFSSFTIRALPASPASSPTDQPGLLQCGRPIPKEWEVQRIL